MNRIKNYYNAYNILFCLIFTLCILGCAENVVVKKPVNVSRAQNEVAGKPVSVASADTKQTIKKEATTIKEDTKLDDQKVIFSVLIIVRHNKEKSTKTNRK
jgi:hypothetical protein